jgi:hypothetical protein
MLIKLTEKDFNKEEVVIKTILLGTESIIKVEPVVLKSVGGKTMNCTKIESRGAMVTTSYVAETVEEIYSLYKSK